ncbi:MAG: hypothetical protein ACPIOQ_33910, partial [Promethearchaeia archaeon]
RKASFVQPKRKKTTKQKKSKKRKKKFGPRLGAWCSYMYYDTCRRALRAGLACPTMRAVLHWQCPGYGAASNGSVP